MALEADGLMQGNTSAGLPFIHLADQQLKGFQSFLDFGPTQAICCHLVVKQRGQDDISQIFAGVTFPSLLITERESTACATALGIICATQIHLASRPDMILDPPLQEVLGLDGPCNRHVLVATTRVPDFREGTYRHWRNGFRQIGRLQSFSSIVPAPGFDDKSDVLAASADSTNPMASEFFSIWRPMGVLPEAHFILIFDIQSSHPEPIPSIELPLDYATFDPAPSPGNSSLLNLDTTNFMHFSASSPASGSPIYSPGSPARHSSGSSAPSRGSRSRSTSPAPYPRSRAASPGQSTTTEVKDLCRLQVSGFETLEAKATWNAGRWGTNLPALARSFYAMEQVLAGLGLDPTDLKAPRQFKLGIGRDIVLTAEGVLTTFGWNSSTFSNKRTMYKRAESVAKRIWANTDTSDPDSPRMYEIYQGVCYLWGESGPLTHFNAALPSSNAPGAEGYAAGLQQGDLKHCEKLLKTYTAT
ncbi:hypothetical protein FB45DRAFT_863018 [Roridomyces roridus]|uniref:Uncharacterized protein n=1 Tax=Roridomyces roridus TaxID=1738132 RepID=A0AAD7C8P3_9AGAR|nr:hypothetical protein FB45DRAFT_863018 [Roridomyces roridus]